MFTYITLTRYYIVQDIFKLQVITASPMWKQKQQSKQNDNNELNKTRKFIILYNTYHLLNCK